MGMGKTLPTGPGRFHFPQAQATVRVFGKGRGPGLRGGGPLSWQAKVPVPSAALPPKTKAGTNSLLAMPVSLQTIRSHVLLMGTLQERHPLHDVGPTSL